MYVMYMCKCVCVYQLTNNSSFSKYQFATHYAHITLYNSFLITSITTINIKHNDQQHH